MKSCSELARPQTANALVLADMHGKDAAAGTCPNRSDYLLRLCPNSRASMLRSWWLAPATGL